LLRLDFRNDLPLADILKTFPMRGWQIALGEILAPVAVLAAFQWLLLLFGAGLVFCLPVKPEALFLAIACGAAFLLPVLDLLLMLIPNAAVLLFPSWIQAGRDSPRGIEATGQRLIFALGQMLVLLLALLPAAAAFTGVFYEQNTHSRGSHRRRRPDRLFPPVPHRLRRDVRPGPAGHPAPHRNARRKSHGRARRRGAWNWTTARSRCSKASCRPRISTKVFAA
jgi:hypothetical protein